VFLRSIGTKYFGGSLLKKRLLRGSSWVFGESLGGDMIGKNVGQEVRRGETLG
jgi:hypothetical protein